jgi:hypothetical protein
MKTVAPAIAKTEMTLIRASGEQISIVVEIGQPFQTADGVLRTPPALHGMDRRISDICGDSMQSLSLAVAMVHRRLASVIKGGGQLLDSDGSKFPLEAYFARD